MICFKCGKQGHKEEMCPMNLQNRQGSDRQSNRLEQHPNPTIAPQEGATYSSWMLVRNPARRWNTRQQQQSGNRDGDHASPNWSSHDENPTRTVMVRERNPNQERRNSEAGNNTVGNLGSRFRALAEIDWNVDMATNDRDDTSPENEEHNFQKESNHIMEESLEVNNMDNIRQINGGRYQEDRRIFPQCYTACKWVMAMKSNPVRPTWAHDLQHLMMPGTIFAGKIMSTQGPIFDGPCPLTDPCLLVSA